MKDHELWKLGLALAWRQALLSFVIGFVVGVLASDLESGWVFVAVNIAALFAAVFWVGRKKPELLAGIA